MRADYAVLLDANVIATYTVFDLYMRLAEEPRLATLRWTEEIWREVKRTLVGDKLKWDEKIADALIIKAQETFPESKISGYEPLIKSCENDPNDRHVLAAAIYGGIETIVTMNIRHFKPEHLQPHGITAQHPGDYLKVLYDLDDGVVVNVLHQMANRREISLGQLLAKLSVPVPSFTSHVATDLRIDIP